MRFEHRAQTHKDSQHAKVKNIVSESKSFFATVFLLATVVVVLAVLAVAAAAAVALLAVRLLVAYGILEHVLGLGRQALHKSAAKQRVVVPRLAPCVSVTVQELAVLGCDAWKDSTTPMC